MYFLPRIAGVIPLKLGQLWQVCHRFLPRIAGVTLCKEWLLEKLLLLSSPHSGGYSLTRLALSNTPKLSSPQCGGYAPKLRPSTQKISFLPRNAGVTLTKKVNCRWFTTFFPAMRGLLRKTSRIRFDGNFLPRDAGVTLEDINAVGSKLHVLPRDAGVTPKHASRNAKLELSSPRCGGYSTSNL